MGVAQKRGGAAVNYQLCGGRLEAGVTEFMPTSSEEGVGGSGVNKSGSPRWLKVAISLAMLYPEATLGAYDQHLLL